MDGSCEMMNQLRVHIRHDTITEERAAIFDCEVVLTTLFTLFICRSRSKIVCIPKHARKHTHMRSDVICLCQQSLWLSFSDFSTRRDIACDVWNEMSWIWGGDLSIAYYTQLYTIEDRRMRHHKIGCGIKIMNCVVFRFIRFEARNGFSTRHMCCSMGQLYLCANVIVRRAGSIERIHCMQISKWNKNEWVMLFKFFLLKKKSIFYLKICFFFLHHRKRLLWSWATAESTTLKREANKKYVITKSSHANATE